MFDRWKEPRLPSRRFGLNLGDEFHPAIPGKPRAKPFGGKKCPFFQIHEFSSQAIAKCTTLKSLTGYPILQLVLGRVKLGKWGTRPRFQLNILELGAFVNISNRFFANSPSNTIELVVTVPVVVPYVWFGYRAGLKYDPTNQLKSQ